MEKTIQMSCKPQLKIVEFSGHVSLSFRTNCKREIKYPERTVAYSMPLRTLFKYLLDISFSEIVACIVPFTLNYRI